MVDDRLRGYPHWLQSRNLANEASDESVPGARHGGPQPLRAAAPLVPPEGAAARARPAQGLRPHGGRHGREPGRALARGARARAGLLLELLPRARRHRQPLPHRGVDRRAGAAGQARGRVLRLHRPVGAPVRDAQLHLAPPRRADARARARPRRARRARRAAGHLPHGDAADAGRDRERVRRVDRVRPPGRAGRDAGVAALAARGVDRGLDRHRLPPDRHEPVRGPHPQRAPRARRARRSTASATCGRSRRRSCWATRSR